MKRRPNQRLFGVTLLGAKKSNNNNSFLMFGYNFYHVPLSYLPFKERKGFLWKYFSKWLFIILHNGILFENLNIKINKF